MRFDTDKKEKIIDSYNKRMAEIEDYFSGKTNKLLIVRIEQVNLMNLIEFLGLEAGLASKLNFPMDNTNGFKH